MKKLLLNNMQNVIFLFFTFISGLFYFCFYLVTLTFGLGMSFTVIGIPILTYVMRSARKFVRYERTQTKIYTDLTIELKDVELQVEGSLWVQAKRELIDQRNWRAIFWLMLKLFVGWISLLCAVLFYIMPLAFIAAPLFVPFVNVQIMTMTIDTLEHSLIVMLAGIVLAFIGGWLGKGITQWIGRYTRYMVKAISGESA
ncbi:sensor domain-containing protein [Paenibacillus sp. GSMTC-2017]|uniref:sensor domain-containing protein n=1 Tax=Paenibacillus sp. GSMTC-2017 TaxID=2794350 RepID=UPI0018D5E3CB|nr:sensor domain-containing protein [Paenibacillus sp. GSMTC-2017]MBH5319962.1 sensor domain-containing protein [Paenibacillus sp. GSMTC-2017]